MVLEKNTQLINNICSVQIKSVDAVVNIPQLQPIYFTPSKIRYTASVANGAHGNLYTKRLTLSYPGIAAENFAAIDSLVKGIYQILIKLQTNEVFEIASENYPMACSSRFTIDNGFELSFTVNSPTEMTFVGIDQTDANTGGSSVFDENFDYDFDFNLA